MGQTIGMQFNIFLNQNLYYLLREPIFLLSILAVNQSKTRRTFDLRWPGLIFPLYSTIRDNGNYLMKIIRFNYSLSHFAIIALATIIIAVNVNRFHCSEQKKKKNKYFFLIACLFDSREAFGHRTSTHGGWSETPFEWISIEEQGERGRKGRGISDDSQNNNRRERERGESKSESVGDRR